MKHIKTLIIMLVLATVLFVVACENEPTTPLERYQSVVISKTTGNGFCPGGGCFSNLTVYANGTATYVSGYNNGTIVEQIKGNIPEQKFSELYSAIATDRFFSLDKEYYDCRNPPTDGGSYTFTFKSDLKNHTVLGYNGCDKPGNLENVDDIMSTIYLTIGQYV